MIIDFHSHILPKFDDGAVNAEMSVEMLKRSRETGVEKIVSTSHCYPVSSESVEEFVAKRDEAYKRLTENITGDVPEIQLGAEVHLASDLSKIKNIKKLCIGDTDYMLVEMPSSGWTEQTVECIYKLTIMGINPIIAHAERNMEQKRDLLDMLYSFDVLLQINSESFSIGRYRKFIDGMMAAAMVHIVGSDMHNISTRPPNIDIAHRKISKRYGAECWEYLMGNAEKALAGERISYRDFKAFGRKRFF